MSKPERFPSFVMHDFEGERRRRRLSAEEREARGLPGPAMCLAVGIGLLLYGVCIAAAVVLAGWWLFVDLQQRLIGG
jgi:hypothetical protein